MQLDEFVESVLIQIATGLANANAKLTGCDNPTGGIPFLMQRGNDSGQTTGVAFDVAITTKSSIEGEGGGTSRLFVADASLGAKAGFEKENVSRIKFTVGVDQRLGYSLQSLSKSANGKPSRPNLTPHPDA